MSFELDILMDLLLFWRYRVSISHIRHRLLLE